MITSEINIIKNKDIYYVCGFIINSYEGTEEIIILDGFDNEVDGVLEACKYNICNNEFIKN